MKASQQTLLLVLTLALLTRPADAESAAPTVLRSVEIAGDGHMVVVTIDLDGTCPLPTAHSLDAPARVYVDLAGVIPRDDLRGVPGAGVVIRARIALNAASPCVTRIVLDLARSEPFRLEPDKHQIGRFRRLR